MKELKIAKYIIAFLYNIDVKRITSTQEDGFIEVYYYNDNVELIDSKVKIDGNSVVWGNLNGRWRNNERDSKITFKTSWKKSKGILTITEKHFSGQSQSKTYKI